MIIIIRMIWILFITWIAICKKQVFFKLNLGYAYASICFCFFRRAIDPVDARHWNFQKMCYIPHYISPPA